MASLLQRCFSFINKFKDAFWLNGLSARRLQFLQSESCFKRYFNMFLLVVKKLIRRSCSFRISKKQFRCCLHLWLAEFLHLQKVSKRVELRRSSLIWSLYISIKWIYVVHNSVILWLRVNFSSLMLWSWKLFPFPSPGSRQMGLHWSFSSWQTCCLS